MVERLDASAELKGKYVRSSVWMCNPVWDERDGELRLQDYWNDAENALSEQGLEQWTKTWQLLPAVLRTMQASSAPADAVRAFGDWFTTVLPREEEAALQGVSADAQQRLHAKLAALSPVASLLPHSAKRAARTATALAPHAKRVRFVTDSDGDSGDDTGNKAAAADVPKRAPQQTAGSAAKPPQNAAA
eukprot:Rhum_TRINITY_DN14643_c13_g2::Rhum_TRINITY_DN14643_c13_g2_i1::g.107462::m.107462